VAKPNSTEGLPGCGAALPCWAEPSAFASGILLPPQLLCRDKMDRLDATQVAEVSGLVGDERLHMCKSKA